VLELLAELLKKDYVPKGGHLLEMGCGDGENSLFLASRGYEVTGVDLSPTAIEWAREKAKQRGLSAAFLLDDVCELKSQPDAVFDFVLDGHCLHCIVEEGRKMFLDASKRVLKPGGFFRVQHMVQPVLTPEKCFPTPSSYDVGRKIAFMHGKPFRYIPETGELLEELKRAGFEILGQSAISADPGRDDRMTGGLRADLRKK